MVSNVQDVICKAEWDSPFYPEVEVYPMSRLIPAVGSKLTKKKWLSLTSDLVQSEFTTVAERLRKAGTWHLNSTKLVGELQSIADNNLFFEPILGCRPINGFSHRFYKPQPGESMDVFGAISTSRNHARLLKKAYLQKNHKIVGKLLGYPECCVDFFIKTWGAKPMIIDPIWQYALNGKHKVIDSNTLEITGDPRTNLLMRYFNLRTTPHICCKPDCEETIKFTDIFEQVTPNKVWSEAMAIIDQDTEWNNLKGIVEVHTDDFIGIANSTTYKDKKVIRWVS